jgi:HPr kinase/phosphorylase
MLKTLLPNPHGVFLVIDPCSTTKKSSIGILISGQPGIGKSAVALDLIDRGHALVVDDAPTFQCQPNGELYGHAPANVQGFLHVRGIGLLNIRQLYGAQAALPSHRLDLIIHLQPHSSTPSPDELLNGDWRECRALNTNLPCFTLSTNTPQRLALHIEIAARHYALQRSGYNVQHDFSTQLGLTPS